MNSLVQKLIRQDAKTFFSQHCEELFHEWTLLLQQTTLPAHTTSRDRHVLDAFAALNARIENGGPFSRLAYVRLTQTLASLRKIIETDRKHGRIPPQKGRGNASIAIDIYLRAAGTLLPGERWRERVHTHLRICRRWAMIGGAFPLLLVSYSDQAESIMYVPLGISLPTLTLERGNFSITSEALKALATDVLRIYPLELIRASKTLAETAQSATESGTPYDAQAVLKQLKTTLQS
jgi:hypothetical protein